MASGALKKTTGLTGLAVCPNPHHVLKMLYGKILRTIEKMPATAAYRKHTELIVQERLQVVESTQNVEEIERKIGNGQVEELIVQAENELFLTRKMLYWRPWERLVKDAPPNQWTWPPTQ